MLGTTHPPCPAGDTYGEGQVQAASLTPGQELPTATLVGELE